jgi:hypothetical protein
MPESAEPDQETEQPKWRAEHCGRKFHV